MFAASPAGAARTSSRHAAMILDANTGAVLHQDNADAQRHPASLTKMMTLYLTFETLAQGRMTMSSRVPISQEAASVAPSKLDLDPGEDLSVRDAVLALITKSANDVAVALAEKIGGSETNFVRLMNAKARELGMSKTNFENPSGLPNPDQVTTARDMITLGLRLQDDFPQYYPLFATRSFSYAGHSHRNHNTLMNHFAGIDGIKTGYTRASGFNLVSSVRRGGRHVVGAVFGGPSAATRNGEMRMLLTRALNKASTVKTRKPQPALIAKLKSEPKRAERPAKPKPIEVAQAAPAIEPAPAIETAPVVEPEPPVARPQAAIKAAKPAVAQPEPARARVPEKARAHVAQVAQAAEPAEASTEPDATPSAPLAQTAATGPGTAAPVAVTKVRRIMVAPRQGPKRPPPGPAETTDMAASDEGLPEVSETIVPKTGSGAPRTFAAAAETKASMLGAASIAAQHTAGHVAASEAEPEAPAPSNVAQAAVVQPPAAPAPRAAPAKPVQAAAKANAAGATLLTASLTTQGPAQARQGPAPARKSSASARSTEAAPAMIQRGTPPSSLSAQAAALKAPKPQRVAALEPSPSTSPANAAAAAAAGRFEIQIGAYASIAEAQRALDAVHARAGAVVANHASVTQPIDKSGRQIYRARYRGFDANSAARACTALRQQSFDCFVMTAQ